MTETKHYIVEMDDEDITPDQVADEFLAHDGNTVMQMTLAGTEVPEMAVTELGHPSHMFKDPTDEDDDDIWDMN